MTEPENPAQDRVQDPLADPDLDQLVPSDEERGEISIDDALETDRVAAEGPDSRNADGFGVDEDLARGADDATAAEQGNRDEDRMEADTDDEQLDEIARGDDDLRL